MAFAHRLPLDNVLYSCATPYPGTEFYKAVPEAGQIDWRSFSQWQVTYVPEGMTESELAAHASRAMTSFYLRPSVWLRHAGRALREGLVLPYMAEACGFLAHALRARAHA